MKPFNRYKRQVSLLKLVLLIITFSVIIYIFGFLLKYTFIFNNEIDINKASKNKSSDKQLLINESNNNLKLKNLNAEVVINNFSFSSLNGNLEPYKVGAEKGVKNTNGDIRLNNVHANIKLDKSNVSMFSDYGNYISNKELLNFYDHVTMDYEGYKLSSNQLEFNLYNKNFIAKNNIELDSKDLNINSDELKSSSNNQKFFFSGNVKTILKSNK